MTSCTLQDRQQCMRWILCGLGISLYQARIYIWRTWHTVGGPEGVEEQCVGALHGLPHSRNKSECRQ